MACRPVTPETCRVTLQVNKYLHTVASGWIFINISTSKSDVTVHRTYNISAKLKINNSIKNISEEIPNTFSEHFLTVADHVIRKMKKVNSDTRDNVNNSKY